MIPPYLRPQPVSKTRGITDQTPSHRLPIWAAEATNKQVLSLRTLRVETWTDNSHRNRDEIHRTPGASSAPLANPSTIRSSSKGRYSRCKGPCKLLAIVMHMSKYSLLARKGFRRHRVTILRTPGLLDSLMF